MQLALYSDLHLEFERYKNGNRAFPAEYFSVPELPTDSETILLLPGDIGVIDKKHTIVPFMEEMEQRFAHVIYVPGNHEYYNGSITSSLDKLRNMLSHTKVHLLDNQAVTIDGVRFIGSTLWTDFDKQNHLMMLQAQSVMSDYKLIRAGTKTDPYERRLHPADILRRHLDGYAFLESELESVAFLDYSASVVLTHHAPCHLSIDPMFAADSNNPLYYSDLGELLSIGPDLWVHGHMHSPCEYTVMDTKVVCNPRGYEPDGEITNYDPTKVIEV